MLESTFYQFRIHTRFEAGGVSSWSSVLTPVVILSGAFTTNIVAAAPVVYCRHVLDISTTVRFVGFFDYSI